MDEYIRETSDDVSAIIHDLELELRQTEVKWLRKLKTSNYKNSTLMYTWNKLEFLSF